MKKSKEISLTKLDLTLVPDDFVLEDREHSSALGYLIPTLKVTKVKPCENVMKLTNKKKKRNILNVEQVSFTVFSATGEWEENVRCFLKNFVNLFP